MAMASEQLHKVKKRSAQQLAYNGWFPAGYQPYAAPHTLDEYDDLSYDFDSALEIDDENPDYEDINLRSIRHVEEDVGTFDMTPADKEFLKSLYDDYGEDTGDYYDYPDTFVPVAIPPPYILLQPQVVQPVYQQQKPAYQHHQIQPEERVLYPPHQPKSANLHHSTVPPQSSIRPSTPRAIRDDQMVVKISRKRHERPVDCDSLKCANLCQQFNYKLGICEVDFDRVLNYPAKCVCSEKAELEEKFKRELAGFREGTSTQQDTAVFN